MRSQLGIQNVLGALYASVIFLGIINSIVLQPIAAENRGVMYRERAAGNASSEWSTSRVVSILPLPAHQCGGRTVSLQPNFFLGAPRCPSPPQGDVSQHTFLEQPELQVFTILSIVFCISTKAPTRLRCRFVRNIPLGWVHGELLTSRQSPSAESSVFNRQPVVMCESWRPLSCECGTRYLLGRSLWR